MSVKTGFKIAALVCFVLALFIASPVALVPLGLACYVAGDLVR